MGVKTMTGDDSIRTGDVALTSGGFCWSLDATVMVESEFCPWCGKRIREVAK